MNLIKRIFATCTAFLLILPLLADRPKNFFGEFYGYQMWNTMKMVPYGGRIKISIRDSIVTVAGFRNDTISYKYCGPHNSGYKYVAKIKSLLLCEFFWISDDSANVQIGMPMEQNYFYKRVSE